MLRKWSGTVHTKMNSAFLWGWVDLSRDLNISLCFIIIKIVTRMFIFVIKIIIKKEQY